MSLALEVSASNLHDERGCDRALQAAGAVGSDAICARGPRANLAEMEGLVREMRPKYLRPKTFIRTKGVQLSEQDKDEFDARLKGIADGAKRMQKKRYQQPFLLSSRLLPEDERIDLDALEQKVARAKEEEKKKKLAVSVVKKPQALASPTQQLKYVSQNSGEHPGLYSFDLTKASCCFVSVEQMPMFASQSEELEFTEEEDRRFRVENVMLHRHFQENLEDAK
ncbi:hypothetical protein BBJ28_00002748 [Nothophytophthora sp. Chile5]|nr:hypothetical protein BBJ28_00002748 [Nothophytophthora sp. Chile5]